MLVAPVGARCARPWAPAGRPYEMNMESLTLDSTALDLRADAFPATRVRTGLRPLPITTVVALSTRVANLLANAGIETFDQLASMHDAALLQIPNLGYAALAEIRDILHKLGLTHHLSAIPRVHEQTRTALEAELWGLTAPAGGDIERGIAMVHFGWDGRLNVEEIRDRYRLRREVLRHIFLAVETQPVPSTENLVALKRATRFIARHTPLWLDEAEQLLVITGLVRQKVTLAGLLDACRLAAIDAGFTLFRTPRLMAIDPSRIEDCRTVIRSVQHLASIRGTTTIDEVRECAEKLLGHPLDRKFVRRSVALLATVHWIDHRLGVVTIQKAA